MYERGRYWGCTSNLDHNKRVHENKVARETSKSLGIPGRDRPREMREAAARANA